MKKLLTGFTLIELLVVIAIIGTLSSIVLSSLDTARSKGNDASIKQQLSDMRASAENDYVDAGLFGNTLYYQVCSASSTSGQIFRSAANLSDRTAGSAVCAGPGPIMYNAEDGSGSVVQSISTPGQSPDKWAASVKLHLGGYFCVDSTGTATITPALSIASNDYLCGPGGFVSASSTGP